VGLDREKFDWGRFDWVWQDGDETVKLDLIERGIQLSPGQGIIPILAGIDSLHVSVRNRARQGLGILKSKAIALEEIYSTVSAADSLEFIHQSSVYSARIYERLKPDLPVQEIRLYMETLLESGGRGPFYAWLFYQSGALPMDKLKRIVATISEPGRLALLDYYLKSPPLIRRRLAGEFKSILRGITSRPDVIRFFARRFDNQMGCDAFLMNLDPELRNPETLVAGELGDDWTKFSPHERATAVKALAMMVPRIAPALVLSLLTPREDKVVRSAVLAVIEASPVGTYADIFDHLLEWILTQEGDDIAGFRALAVSSPSTLLSLVNTVKTRAPYLMGPIFDELTKLSRIAFLFVQAIAMDRDSWLGTNPEISRALVCGMVHKRPERIIALFKKFGHGIDTKVEKTLIALSEAIETTLAKEKNQITRDGSKLRFERKSFAVPGKPQSFFKKMRTGSLKKQLLNLKQAGVNERTDFTGTTMDRIDLSSGSFFSPTIFDGCTMTDSNLSFSSFENYSFNSALLDTVDLNGATFDSVNFNRAAFINVSAKGALFINCSFENASFFAVNLESARMFDCIFTGAHISASRFVRADLSGSTFAAARTDNVTFVQSILIDSDFSGVQSRFTRFSTHIVSTLEAEDANFNARKFLFDQKELPDFLFEPGKRHSSSRGDLAHNYIHDPLQKLVQEVDLLILTDLLHSGEKLFLNQNKFSLLAAMDVFKPKQADLFEIIPLLIHENLIFPGYKADSLPAPRGIANYRPCRETCATASLYLGSNEIFHRFCETPHVESLFTMGSTGTIAQTRDSDIDYWVCVRGHDPESLEGKRFQQKLTLIEQWALNEFKAEIHFFIVDIDRARNDDFGDSTGESSGSAQGLILKEEFYRTMIHVAGKLTFWCTLPVGISRTYYDLLLSRVCINPVTCRFVDFGDIHVIPSEEYFGASIWQLFKLLKSPFKSVIKMALLEKFIHAKGNRQLLCNRFKKQWMNPGLFLPLGKIDPYYTLLESVMEFYEQADNPGATRLVQQCFFLKTGIESDLDRNETLFGLRSFFINWCMQKWSWTRPMVVESGNFKEWQYSKITRLSQQIQQYMVKTYIRVNQAMNNGQTSTITPEDRTVIGRKMFVEFSSQPGKIPRTLLVSRSDRHFTKLTLIFAPQQGNPGRWELVNHPSRSNHDDDGVISQGGTIEEIAAWLVHNQLFSPSTIINLYPNPTPVSSDDIQRFFQALYLFFVNDSSQTIPSINLLSTARIVAVFISLNLCVPRKKKRVHELSAIYFNSWGEMFCINIVNKQGFLNEEEILEKIKVEFKLEQLPPRVVFHYPRGFRF